MKMYRELLREDLKLNKFTTKEILELTNQTKHYLLHYGAVKGDVVNVSVPLNGINQFATILACLELGLVLHVNPDDTWKRENQQLVHRNMKKYWGASGAFLDFLVDNNTDASKQFHKQNYEGYEDIQRARDGGFTGEILTLDEVAEMPTDDIQPWEVYDDDVALQTCEGLLTGDLDNWYSGKVLHGQFMWRIMNTFHHFNEDDTYGYGMSYHHGQSLEMLFGAMHVCKNIKTLQIPSSNLYGLKHNPMAMRESRKFRDSQPITVMYELHDDMMHDLYQHLDSNEDGNLKIISY